jgi:hypothetical protein
MNLQELWFYKYFLFMAIYIRGWYYRCYCNDAQVNYELPKLKSTLKLGASNIGGIWTSISWIDRATIFCCWTINP